MTDKVLLSNPQFQYIVNGKPAAGYKVFIYDAGTTTKAPTWTGEDGLTNNTNPAILDAEGRATFWVPPIAPVPVSPIPPGPPGPQGASGPPGPPGATGNLSEFSSTIDLSAPTIYTGIFGDYIEVAPNTDPTVLLVPTQILLGLKYQTTPYAMNGGSFVLNWGPPIAPVAVPGGSFSAAFMENVFDCVYCLDLSSVLSDVVLTNIDAIGKPLTLTLDTDLNGANLISIDIVDGGNTYAVNDTGTIDGGDDGATYIVTSVDGGVVDGITLTAGGLGYSSETAASTTVGGGQPGTGTGLTLNTTSTKTIAGTLRVYTFYRRLIVQ